MRTTSLPQTAIDHARASLGPAIAPRTPASAGGRQPVHTFYGGAHLFGEGLVQKLGKAAIQVFEEHAADPVHFATLLQLPGAETLTHPTSPMAAFNVAFDDGLTPDRRHSRPSWLAHTVHARVLEKLRREPVEDLRVDFEDGYGIRSDAEEDGHAIAAAHAIIEGALRHSLPPFLGIRIKPLDADHLDRAIRTLDRVITALATGLVGALPPGFVVTLPKITAPAQVTVLCDLLDALEAANALPAGAIAIELMIETPECLIGAGGDLLLPRLHALARGRLVAAHFGAYDYTAACDIAAAHQSLTHPACDFARHLMKLGFAGQGIRLSDGATTTLPLPVHKGPRGSLSDHQIAENQRAIHRAWKLHYDQIQHALAQGFYQGWDLHPAQLPIRYAATYAFFLDNAEPAAERLKNFVERAAQATRIGQVFDDAATGQGLLTFFLRALTSGAIPEDEILRVTTLDARELRSRSFLKIIEGRARRG